MTGLPVRSAGEAHQRRSTVSRGIAARGAALWLVCTFGFFGLPTPATAQDPDDIRWADGFSLGSAGPFSVEAMVPYATGLVVGGMYNYIGNVTAHNVAFLDGTTWRPMENAFNSGPGSESVEALTLHAGSVFAGGTFPMHIVRWNGVLWQAVLGAFPYNVYALTSYNEQIYLGTQFGVYRPVNNLWQKIPGFSGWVFGFGEYQGQLVVAGWNPSGGVHLLRWNGSVWDGFGSGPDDAVEAVTVFENDLVAGGWFTHAGGVAADRIARWDGTTWRAFDASAFAGPTGRAPAVRALAFYDGDLIAGGLFTRIGTTNMNNVARWDGTAWHPLANGVTLEVQALAPYAGKLAAAGQYGGRGWNGQEWTTLDAGAGVDYSIFDYVVDQGTLVAGGAFLHAGQLRANSVARWDGSAWSLIGGGFDRAVWAVAIHHGELVAAGDFETSGATSVNHVARWDGAAWRAFGSGLDANCDALATYQDDLIAGGDFLHAGGVAADRVARWDGTAWNAMGPGLNGAVHALTVYSGSLFAGGEFTAPAQGPAIVLQHVARWNGSAWEPVGEGFDATVAGFSTFAAKLVAVGEFTHSGASSLRRVAAWNGSTWEDVGGGVDAPARAACEYRQALYVAGAFQSAGIDSASRVARWDGQAWTHLGSGVNWDASALEVYGNRLFVGGGFWQAGNKASSGIASWDLGDPVDVADGDLPASTLVLHSPYDSGPARPVRIEFNVPGTSRTAQLAVFDVRGRVLRVLRAGAIEGGMHACFWDRLDGRGARVTRGVYFIRLQAGSETRTRKLLLRF